MTRNREGSARQISMEKVFKSTQAFTFFPSFTFQNTGLKDVFPAQREEKANTVEFSSAEFVLLKKKKQQINIITFFSFKYNSMLFLVIFLLKKFVLAQEKCKKDTCFKMLTNASHYNKKTNQI